MQKALKNIPLPNSRELYRLVTDYGNKYSEALLAEKARADAEQNIPELQSTELAAFEKQLVQEASILASKIVSQYKKALEMLDAKIKAQIEFLEREKIHLEENIDETASLETDSIDNSHILKDAHKQLEKAEERYDAFYALV